MNLFDLKDKIIVVTGGNGQLGRQYVGTIVEHGGTVCVLDRSFDLLKTDKNIHTFECDITDKTALEKCCEKILKEFGRIDGLVNNAALDSPPDAPASETGPFEDYPESSWNKVMDVNVKGTFLCSQVFGKVMADQAEGSIINISSIYGVVSPDQGLYEYRRQRGEEFYKPVAYSASKSAIINLTKYMATYWGKKGVRVNCLVLAGVFNNQDDQFLNNYCSRIPMGRMAEEDEYNGSIVYLLSKASRYMTGATMTVDGGWTAI